MLAWEQNPPGLLVSSTPSCDGGFIYRIVQHFHILSVYHTNFFPVELGPRGEGRVTIIFGGHSVEANLPSQGF